MVGYASVLSVLIALVVIGKTAAGAADQPDPIRSQMVVRNGGMTVGGAVPADWKGKDVEVARDVEIIQTGPASLRVRVAGGKRGHAS